MIPSQCCVQSVMLFWSFSDHVNNTGRGGGERDGGAPSLPAQPVQQAARPRHERQRQRHQDKVRQPLLLPGVHHRQSQAHY